MSARSTAGSRSRSAEISRLVLGVQELRNAGRPDASGQLPAAGEIAVLRVVGVRQIVQAVLLLRSPTAGAHTLGAVVDVAHAATMVPLMLGSTRLRRLAARQFVVALGLAVVEILLVGTGSRRR